MAERASNQTSRQRAVKNKAVNNTAAKKVAAGEAETKEEAVRERKPATKPKRPILEAVDEALGKLAEKIAEGNETKDLVVNFEKLLKVRKEMGGDEDQPNLIRVIWEESTNENSSDE